MARKKRVRLDKKGRPIKPKREAAQAPAAEPEADEAEEPDCECPYLVVEDWDGVESDWSDIQFVRVHAKAILGVPVGFDNLREKLRKAADEAGATIPPDAMLLLGSGRFLRPVMMEVENADPSNKNVVMPGGVAFSRVHPAPWGEMGKLAKTTGESARERYGRNPDHLWLWYLTCKECSSQRNYETLFIAHYRNDPVAVS